MSDIESAKSLLVGDKTIVLVRGNDVISSTKNGIAPMMEFLQNGQSLEGFSVADKIVGKAVAMLFDLARVKEVFAELASKPAVEYLKSRNIKITYNSICDNILNRTKTGLCPMEQAVIGESDPKVAYQKLKAKIEMMKNKTSQ